MHRKSKNTSVRKELRKIKMLHSRREIFICLLSMGILICFGIAYRYKVTEEFISSLFLNIAGGLLTGLVITIWFRLNDKFLEKFEQERDGLQRKLSTCQIEEFVINSWVDTGFPYTEYDRLTFYADEVKRFKDDCMKCRKTVKYVSTYFRHSKEIVQAGKEVRQSTERLLEKIENYTIREICLIDPNDMGQDEQRVLEAISLLYRGEEEVTEEECLEVIQFVKKINLKIKNCNILIRQEVGKYRGKLEKI